ncbi:MAG: LLM class F420-dependent oxidoreductase [Stenotrophomonas maltophilia]
MKIGFSLANNQGIEDIQALLQMAVHAEELGFESVWASDHVFNAGHVFERIGDKPYYEPLTVLSYVAATTKKVLLGTSVLVLPYHNPINLAKTSATLDVMSGGRLVLGVGVGAVENEMEAMGSPFAERGAITDESIAIMKELWTQQDPSFQGRFHSFSGMKFSPKPVQKPHIPLIIGGSSRVAIRRAARAGNGWHPTALPPEELSEGIRYLGRQAEAAGRDPSEIPVSVSAPIGAGRAGRYSLGTDPGEILEKARIYQDLGVERLVVSTPNSRNGEKTARVMEMLAREVLPQL